MAINSASESDDFSALEECPPPTGEPWFVDGTASSGLDFVHHSGSTGEYYFPEMIGSGAALFDYDDDGDLDLYLVQGTTLDASGPSLIHSTATTKVIIAAFTRRTRRNINHRPARPV